MKRITLALAIIVGLSLVGSAEAGRLVNGKSNPGFSVRTVSGLCDILYHETFRGQELAIVTVAGDGFAPLVLEVYDSQNVLVARSNVIGRVQTVRFTPPADGVYRIEVRNMGFDWSLYTLTTN